MRGDLWRWRVAVVAVVFVLGAVFGRFVLPLLYRDHVVMVIHGSRPGGCHGGMGVTPVRFGWYGGTGDGVYHRECGERSREADNLELQCDCGD